MAFASLIASYWAIALFVRQSGRRPESIAAKIVEVPLPGHQTARDDERECAEMCKLVP